MKNKEFDQTTRNRRTKKELEHLIWDAFERLAIKDGFYSITLVKLAREADVEPPVIYKRFKDAEDLFEQYVQRNDFWLNRTIAIDPNLSPKECVVKVLTGLIDHMYDNEIMQRILLTVLNNTNETSRQIAANRERSNKHLIEYLHNGLKDYGVSADVIVAIMLGGIYYLVLHRKVGTVNMVDFNKEENKELMKKAIREMTNKIFRDA